MDNKFQNLIFAIVIFTGFFGIAGGAEARTEHYVCASASGLATGADWNNCWDYTVAMQASTKWCTTSTYPKSSPTCDNLIGAGDTVYIDGGTNPGVTYTSFFKTYQSGVAGHPITIKLKADDASHNYKVIIDPNFSTLDSSHKYGMLITKDHIVVDGEVDGTKSMLIKNAFETGIEISGVGTKVTYVEVTNNGAVTAFVPCNIAVGPSSNPTTAQPIEISYSYIHDPADLGQNLAMKKSSSNIDTDYGRTLIHHNIFYNADGDHIETALGGVDIYNNEFSNNTITIPEAYDTIHVMGDYYRIYNNSFHTMHGGGFIYLQYTAGYSNAIAGHTVVENNLFYDNGTSGSAGITQSFYVQSPDIGVLSIDGLTDIYIVNNTFDHVRGVINTVLDTETTWDSNKDSSTTVSNYYIVDNIIKNAVGYAIALGNLGNGTVTTGSWGSGANIIYDYNNIYSDGTGDHITGHEYNGVNKTYPATWKTACNCASNDQSDADPLFSTGAYSLSSLSSAKDHGVAISYAGLPLTSDYIGTSRPQGSAWDIGAYEYVQESDTTPPAAPVGLTVQ